MKEIKPVQVTYKDEYHVVISPNGTMRCSCGEELIKMDEHTYRCGSSAGWPIYRFEDGTIFIDKFGNLMLKAIDHGRDKENE